MKALTIIGVTGLVLSALPSCSDGKTNKTLCEFESYTKSAVYALAGSAADYGYSADVTVNDSVALVIPVKLNNSPAEVLRDSILCRALGSYGSNVSDVIENWIAEASKETGYTPVESAVAPAAADGFRRIQGRIVNMSTDVFSYCIATSIYLPGAANGLETMDYLNYSLEENRLITLSDLFTPEGLNELPAVIAEQAENNPRYAGEVTIESLPQNDNFYLSSEGEIVFSYQPMEVGPHSLGNVQVAFTPAELVAYMTPSAIKKYNLEDLVAE